MHDASGTQLDPRSTLRQRVDYVMNSSDSLLGRVFAYTIQTLIVLSILTYSLETLPGLTSSQAKTLQLVETVTVLLFTAEYIVRLWASPNPLRYAFSFFGLIDLVAILPFWLATGMDLRYARILRMLRLFRILKLTRYNRAMRRFHTAMLLAREEIVVYLCLTGMLLFISAAGIYHFESEAQPDNFSSIFSALWWSLATLTTVGYGDVYPVTVGGRCFTAVMLMLGLGIVAVPAGLVASALSTAREMEESGKTLEDAEAQEDEYDEEYERSDEEE